MDLARAGLCSTSLVRRGLPFGAVEPRAGGLPPAAPPARGAAAGKACPARVCPLESGERKRPPLKTTLPESTSS